MSRPAELECAFSALDRPVQGMSIPKGTHVRRRDASSGTHAIAGLRALKEFENL